MFNLGYILTQFIGGVFAARFGGVFVSLYILIIAYLLSSLID